MNAHTKIRQGMRQREVDMLSYLRRNQVSYLGLFNIAEHNALDRLERGGMVSYEKKRGQLTGFYKVRKGARPVTPAVRRKS